MANTDSSAAGSLIRRLTAPVLRLAAADRLAFGLFAAVLACLILNLALIFGRVQSPAVQTSLSVEQLVPVTETSVSSEEALEPILKPGHSSKQKRVSFTFAEEASDGDDSFVAYSGGGVYLQIPNSYISSAVAQGSDNSFYLNHNIYGAYDWRGCIYAHYRCNLSSIGSLSQNTVLFGHNKTTNRYGSEVSNFSTLPRFQDYSFAESHRVIYLTINGETAAFVVFAALDCEVWNDSAFPYWYPEVSSSIISEARNRSYWDYSVDVSTSDRLITLSTCSYDWGYDSNYNTYAKFVVMARKLRAGESVSGFGGISANTDRKTPSGLSRVQ